MMNIEKNYKEILEFKECFAVNKDTGKVFNCSKGACDNCKFSGANNDYGCSYCSCTVKFRWLFEEYKEPLLTEDEKEFLKSFIKLFGCKKPTIAKRCSNLYPCQIYLRVKNGNYACDSFYFDEDKLFKGLELDKEYTLKDLGLDE